MSETLSSTEERDLIASLADRPDAFRHLYRAYVDRIFAYVAYRVGRRQDAEDITADIFMIVVEKIHQFEYRGDGSFAAWLFRIAHHAVAQFYRQAHSDHSIPFDDLPTIIEDSILPDEAIMRQEQFARLQQMIATLSPRRQEVISLRFFGQLQNKEIAAVLGLDERTVASHLSRALADLKTKYKQKEYPNE